MNRSLSLVAISLTVAACGKKDAGDKPAAAPATAPTPGTPATPPSGTAAAPTPVAPPAPATSSIKVDDELLAALKAEVAACTIEPKDMKIACPGGEDKHVKDELLGYSGRAQVAAVPTLAVALADADPKLATVAADALGGSRFTGGWGEGVAVGAVSKDVARLLLATVEKLPAIGPYQARRVIGPVVLAASLADLDADAHAMLERHPDEWVQRGGWKASTLYGRLKAFPKLEVMSKDESPAPTLVAATALNSFYKLTDDERATLCPWAVSKLAITGPGAEAEVFGQIGAILTNCKGAWIDQLQDFGDAQLAKQVFDRQYYFVFRELCHDFIKGQTTDRATAAQCERNFKFLEKVANTDGIAPADRGRALDAISYQRRDATSLKLMQKYKQHKVKEIAEAAQAAIKMLEGYVQK
ncbi:MAG: hypothetical protein R3B06_02475 [Kofleriaceae bacterium]